MQIRSLNSAVIILADKLNPTDQHYNKMIQVMTKMLPRWRKHKDEWILYQKLIFIQSFVLLISLMFHVVFDILSHK